MSAPVRFSRSGVVVHRVARIRQLLICLLLCAAIHVPAAIAQESEIAWKVSSFAGPDPQGNTYPTQQQGEEAIKRLPNPFPSPNPNPHSYIDRIKGQGPRADGSSAVVYWMGLHAPLDPDWSYRHVTNTTVFTTEAAMVASLKAQYDTDYPHCPIKATLAPAGDWAATQPANVGRIEERRYNVEYYDGRNTPQLPCVKKTEESRTARSRRQRCPNPYLQRSVLDLCWSVELHSGKYLQPLTGARPPVYEYCPISRFRLAAILQRHTGNLGCQAHFLMFAS